MGLLGSAAVVIAGGALDLAFPEDARAQNEGIVTEVPATGPDDPNPAAAPDVAAAIGTPFAPDAASRAGVAGDGSATMTSLGGADIAVSSTGGSYEVDAPGNRDKWTPKAKPRR